MEERPLTARCLEPPAPSSRIKDGSEVGNYYFLPYFIFMIESPHGLLFSLGSPMYTVYFEVEIKELLIFLRFFILHFFLTIENFPADRFVNHDNSNPSFR